MRLSITAGLLCAAAFTAAAQSFPLQIRIQSGNDIVTVPNNSTFNVNVDATGSSADIRVTVTNLGRNEIEIPGLPQLFGPRDFTLTGASGSEFPLRLAQGTAIVFTVRFTASSSAAVTGQIAINYTEIIPPATVQQTQPTLVPGIGTLTIIGTAPEMIISYALLPDQNVVPLTNGTEIPFGLVPIENTAQALILLTNRGSGRGLVNSIAVTGSRFQAAGIPLLPLGVPGGSELRFTVRYSPTEIRADTGTLDIGLPKQSFSFPLAGRGAGPIFTYEILGDTSETPVAAGQAISFPDTRIGDRATVTLRIRNTGNANGLVASVGASGAAFSVVDLPTIPATVRPSGFVTAGIQFAPAQAGTLAGRLRIGDDTFNLSGRGIGSQLLFSYSSAETVNTVTSGGSIFFPPTPVSQTSSVTLMVRNTGTTATSLTSIGLADSRNFRIEGLPPLPLRLEADAARSFTLSFTPINTGQTTTSLFLDSQAFTLSGFGSAAPTLPPAVFTGTSSGPVSALAQPALGLSLAQTYPIAVQGQLTLSVEAGTNAADPAVQFATGGRTVAFSIPANSLEAIFAGGSNRIRLQTGSVAGTISVTPAFTSIAGLELTSSSPATLLLVMAPAAPRLLAVQIVDRTATGFTLALSGITNTRALSNLEVTFTPVSGTTLSNSRLTVNLSADAGAWFRGTASQAFGGQFSIAFPFTIAGGAAGATSLIDQVQSVSVTVANEQGASNAVTANFR